MNPTPQQQSITLPATLVQSVVDYLAERPYRETAGLIQAILQAAQEQAKANGGTE